jgi:hypothetical protein
MFRIGFLAIALLAVSVPAGAIASTAADSGTKSMTKPHCGASDPLVWVNTKSKVFHTSGDPYFGNTKAGKYACTSQATAMGAHLAGSSKGSHAMSGAKGAANADESDSSAATPAPHAKKHHKSSVQTPDDSATP